MSRVPGTTYLLEISPSGRAKCKGACGCFIDRDEIRFASVAPPDDDFRIQKYCRHLFCVTKRVWINAVETYGSLERIPGFASLSAADQETVVGVYSEIRFGVVMDPAATASVGEQEEEYAQPQMCRHAAERNRVAAAAEVAAVKEESAAPAGEVKPAIAATAAAAVAAASIKQENAGFRAVKQESEVEDEYDEAEDGLEVEAPLGGDAEGGEGGAMPPQLQQPQLQQMKEEVNEDVERQQLQLPPPPPQQLQLVHHVKEDAEMARVDIAAAAEARVVQNEPSPGSGAAAAAADMQEESEGAAKPAPPQQTAAQRRARRKNRAVVAQAVARYKPAPVQTRGKRARAPPEGRGASAGDEAAAAAKRSTRTRSQAAPEKPATKPAGAKRRQANVMPAKK